MHKTVSQVNVCFWHKADMAIALNHVRYRGFSGQGIGQPVHLSLWRNGSLKYSCRRMARKKGSGVNNGVNKSPILREIIARGRRDTNDGSG